jgi:hypothetical protein
LLIVLSLLTLFTLLLVTFILVSGHHRKAAVASARGSRDGQSPERVMERVLLTLLRDTVDDENPMRFHSLLYDMYGLDGFVGELARVDDVGQIQAPPLADGTKTQFFDLRLRVRAPSTGDPTPLNALGAYHQLSLQTGYYNGCLITVSSGPARGRTFRIVGYRPATHAAATATALVNPTNHVFRVMAIPSRDEVVPRRNGVLVHRPDAEDFNGNGNLDPGEDQNGNGELDVDRVVVNGRPFNGRGFGYGGGTPALDADYTLQPNQLFRDVGTTRDEDGNGVADGDDLLAFAAGDADESYDAVDFQNMALAGIIPTGNLPQTPDQVVVLPSFHRPALINYQRQQGNTPADIEMYRAIMRPMPWDHPDFDGSNPRMNADRYSTGQILDHLSGVERVTPSPQYPKGIRYINPWDVDNDGDQIADSVWLDLGYPAQATPDGRMVKPLFAILCVDLDGKLNLNAAGNWTHVNLLQAAPVGIGNDVARKRDAGTRTAGFGYGPADINLGYNTNYPLFSRNDYYNLLGHRHSSRDELYPPPGANPVPVPGAQGQDGFGKVKHFEFPQNWFAGNPSAHGSPADLFAELSVSTDHTGQPYYFAPRGSRADMLTDNPYEIDLSGPRRGRDDQPFAISDFERLLRYRDHDVGQLSDRLLRLVGVGRRRLVTTDSFDLPIPNLAALPSLRGSFTGTTPISDYVSYGHDRPLHLTDLLVQRLKSPPAVADSAINDELEKMLGPELFNGTRLNVNRPFGNATDDNNNFVVDEHVGQAFASVTPMEGGRDGVDNDGDLTTDEPDEVDPMWSNIWSEIAFEHSYTPKNRPATDDNRNDAYLARHLFARHLYVLAMLVKDSTFNFDTDADTDTTGTTAETAAMLAQWAINVVDFRDVDSIMTPFEYDENPFNGWNVDGNIATDEGGDRKVVWGCERPELLITETLAFHDRRTEDLGTDDDTSKKTNDPMMPDDDYDQRLRPRGSLFIELHNPWSGQVGKPAEFYSDGTAIQNGVVLNKRAPLDLSTTPAPGAPVWRMVVVGAGSHATAPGTAPPDPDDPDANHDGPAPGVQDFNDNIERGIYFADPSAVTVNTNETRHWSSLAMNPLQGGRFAVVGSGQRTGADYITTIGRRTDAEDDGQTSGTTMLNTGTTRRIVLTAPAAPAATSHQVRIFDNDNGINMVPPDPAPVPPNEIQEAVAVVINQPQPGGEPKMLSISEPPAGYTGAGWDPTAASSEGAYTTPKDTPFHDDPLPAKFVDSGVWDEVADPTPSNAMMGGDPLDRNHYAPNVRTLHLQRLANPLLPWNSLPGEPGHDPNKPVNPYRTVDRAQIDLCVFEGVWDPNGTPMPPLASTRTKDEAFGSRERGTTDTTSLAGRKLWNASESTVEAATNPLALKAAPTDSQVHDYYLDHTLGFLNDTYGNRFDNTDPVLAKFRGGPKTTTLGTDGEPFPWLQWNNRPFVSQLELMLVPHTGCSRLLENFTLELDPTKTAPQPFADVDPTDGGAHDIQPGRQFGHLLNFFASSQTANSVSNLYRLFDYTHVPSRFLGTETWFDPVVFGDSGAFFGTSPYHGTELFRPPFNRVSNFRDPGRVNINTIFSPRIWDALRGRNGPGPRYAGTNPIVAGPNGTVGLVDSRRGYGWPGDLPVDFGDGDTPTFFANPFRSAAGGDFVPGLAGSTNYLHRDGIECTLLRSSSIVGDDTPTPPGYVPPPLVPPPSPAPHATLTSEATDPLFATAGSNAHDDGRRNPQYRYHGIQRLANMVTTRSNVYAVWITMGLFEVTVEETTAGSGVYVERLGQEAGRDSGNIVRHRAFYVIDRSIPVAFEPGKNHNVERAILLRRLIE